MKARPTLAFWPLVYVACIALAALLAFDQPGGAAPVFVAVALPAALALSRVRGQGLFGAWILFFVPLVLVLWRFAGDRPLNAFLPFGVVPLVGCATFLWQARAMRSGGALALLGGLVCLVAYFSSGHGGSGSMLDWFVARGLSKEAAYAATLAFRKTVHFTFYATVGWAALRAAFGTGSLAAEAARSALLAALAVASFDELRQTGYASRTGSAWDVLLDLAGAATAIGLSVWRHRRLR